MATISAFRGSRRRRTGNQMILCLPDITSKDTAKTMIGKKVTWTAPGKDKKKITGKISAAHGNKGCVRVIFEKGLPGQSLGKEAIVEVTI